MRPVKKLDKATRRKRQQWRDAKRRSRTREREYKDAMQREATRQRFAPVEVKLGDVDLTPWVRSVDVIEECELEETTGGLFTREGLRRYAPGLRRVDVGITLLSDGREGWVDQIRNSDEVRLVVTRLGHVEHDGPVRVKSLTSRVRGAGDLFEVEVHLVSTGAPR